MQGCVDLLPCPPERTGATFCRVSGGDSDAWRPHPKAPAGPGPASETGGRPVPDNTTVTQLGIGSHQPWILVFLSHQTVPGLPADSGYRDAGRRARDPPICSRLVAEGGRSGPWGRPRARWRSGSVGSGCPGEVRSGRSRMVGGAVPPTLSRRFAQLRPHFRRIRGAISTR